MKILVCAYRHWTAGRRFRSLLLNGPKAGHEIIGLAIDWEADQAMTIATFNEFGIEAFPKEQSRKAIEGFNPDVVFGEFLLSGLERKAQDWVNKHGKIGLINNHNPYLVVYSHYAPKPEWSRTYFLATSEQQAMAAMTNYSGEEAIRNWPESRLFVIGASDLDFVTERVDTAEVRERLGVEVGQPLIGLFPTCVEQEALNSLDFDEISTLVGKCQDAGWQVIIHPHPLQRRIQNTEGRNGFYVYDRKFIGAGFWPKIQAMGARFIADYAPGRTCGVEFPRCQSFELIQAADCLIGSYDPFFEAYALKKSYVHLTSEAPRVVEKAGYKEVLDREFQLQDNFTKVSSIVERGNDLEQDPAFVERWFWRLDGLWWKRALDIAEELLRADA